MYGVLIHENLGSNEWIFSMLINEYIWHVNKWIYSMLINKYIACLYMNIES